MSRIRQISLAWAAATGLVGAPVHAQEIEGVIVTAQKKSEDLQKVPIAMTAVTGAVLAESGIKVTEDLNTITPGLNFGRASGGAVVLLRGVGALTAQAGQDASVPLFVDGVYQVSGGSALLPFNNVERVEVLKGPQGTLYGRNASGGAINIVTRTPSTVSSGELEAGYGNYDTTEGRLYGTTALGSSNNAAADIALYYSHQGEGWGRNVTRDVDVGKRKDFSARSKLRFQPTDATRITLGLDYSSGSGSTGTNYRPGPTTTALTGQVGFLFGFYDTQSGGGSFTGNKAGGVNARIDQDLSSLTLVSITAWQKARRKEVADLDTVEPQIIDYRFTANTEAFTQELQLHSDQSRRLRWIVGAFFLNSEEGYEPFILEGPGVAPFATITQTPNYQKTISYAAFGQATFDIADATRLTVGLRHTVDKREVDARSTGEFPGEAPGRGSVEIFDVHDTETFRKPTWRMGVDHDFTPDVMGFATYSRGFKSGIHNLSVPNSPAVKPEVLDAYETGVKATLFDRRLRFNPSVFYYDYKDIQAANIVGGQQFLRNAAKAEIYGVDLDFEAAITDSFTISGGMEWLHARYENFRNAPVTFPNPNPPFANIQVDCAADPVACDVSGNHIPRTAEWSLGLVGDYRIPLPVGEVGLNVSYAYNDGWYWEADNRTVQEPFHIVNTQVEWTPPGDRFSVRLWARNLLAEKYYAQEQAALTDLYVPAPPRTYGVTVGVKF